MLSVSIAGIELKNPTILAAGLAGTNQAILKRVADNGAGAVTLKSIGPVEREGNPNPTILATDMFVANAVGLSSPGYKNMEEEWEGVKDFPVPVIASFYAGSVEEFVEIATDITKHKPAMLEINIGCPNTKSHGMVFGTEPEMAGEVVRAVKEVTDIPVMPKLTPNTHKYVEVAKACVEQGADVIGAFNTWGPGMLIDTNTTKPVFAFKSCGISGPAVKPLTVRGVFELYKAVDVPIVALGGVTTGNDAVEMIMAGATAVGIGSGIYYRGLDVFKKVCDEMKEFMELHGYSSLKDMRGVAHE